MSVSIKSIITLPEVCIVEASAGSGKTFSLAKRYVQLLMDPSVNLEQIPIRSILALTFTNKASFEMKERILQFLKLLSLKKMPPALFEEILGLFSLTPDEASIKASIIMQSVIHHYNFFQVQTIDKFINALLSGCAFKIGLTANFRIETNASDYVERSLDELLDRIVSEKGIAKSFEEFLHQYIYLEGRTGWFPKKDMLVILTTLYRQFNCYGLPFVLNAVTSQDILKHKRKLLEDIKTFKESVLETADGRFLKSVTTFLENNESGFDIDNLSDYFVREQAPIKKDAKMSSQTDRLWEKIREDIHTVTLAEAFGSFNPYIDIFNQTNDIFLSLSAKDDCLFLEELNRRAALLFDKDRVTVEELYYRLAARFKHYLVDEFQDTSRLQWHNLERMVEEGLSTGGSLFYVGDRKQAIYGFRGGDVKLFDHVKDQFKHFHLHSEALTQNYRSHKEIVDFNNTVFSLDNLRQFILNKEAREDDKRKKNAAGFSNDDINEIAHIYGQSSQAHQKDLDKGCVSVQYVDIDKKEERAAFIKDRLVATIKDVRKRFAYKDIAILARSNAEIEEITSWLLHERILVESERTSNVKENNHIKEIVSFLQFLDSPIDNLAFTQFILGDLFATAAGLSKEELHDFVFSLRKRLHEEEDFYVYMAFREKYKEIWQNYLEDFFKNVGLFPLYELLVSIYSRLNCLKNFPEAQGFFMHFLELIKLKEDKFTDLTSFLEYFDALNGDDLYVEVTDSDAVKLLTVHKSKGLEFPVVIIPFLGMDIQVGASSDDNQQSYVLREHENQMQLIRLKTKYRIFAPELEAIYQEEYKKAFISELNNVYVATTRPQVELHIMIPKKVSNSFNIVKFLIPENLYQKGNAREVTLKQDEKADVLDVSPAKYHDWIDYLKDEFLSEEEAVYREQRLKGEVFHFILSLVKDTAKESIVLAVKEAADRFSHVEMADYQKTVEKFLNDKKIKPFFDVKDAVVLTEKEIVNKSGHTKRVDRLIIFEDEIWVVDFKSSLAIENNYQEQVKEYMVLITALYPKYKIKGYLIGLDKFNVQEVYADIK